MAVTRLDAAVGSDGATTTYSVSAGTDRALIVAISWETSATDVSVTYGGVAMTEVFGAQEGVHGSYMFILLDADIEAASGTTVTPTWTGGTPGTSRIKYACASYEGVDQTGGSTTVPAFAEAIDRASNPYTTLDLTEAVGDLIVANYQNVSSSTVTWSAAMTQQTHETGGLVGSFADRLSTTDANVDIECTGPSTNARMGSARIAQASAAPPAIEILGSSATADVDEGETVATPSGAAIGEWLVALIVARVVVNSDVGTQLNLAGFTHLETQQTAANSQYRVTVAKKEVDAGDVAGTTYALEDNVGQNTVEAHIVVLRVNTDVDLDQFTAGGDFGSSADLPSVTTAASGDALPIALLGKFGLAGSELPAAPSPWTDYVEATGGLAVATDDLISTPTTIGGETWTGLPGGISWYVATLTLQEASASTGHAESDVDTVGLADEAGIVRTSVREAADSSGLSDAGASIDRGLSRADAVGLADQAVTSVGVALGAVDVSGLADGFDRAYDAARASVDTAGLSDSAVVRIASDGADIDDLGLSDSVDVARSSVRSQVEAAGLTDSATASISGAQSLSEPLGLSDAPDVALDASRASQEPLGLSESVEVTKTISRIAGDLLGLGDTSSSDVAGEGQQTSTDLAGISDTAETAKTIVFVHADALGGTDTAGTSVPGAADVVELAGISDSYVIDLRKSIVDDLGATDAADVEGDDGNTIVDQVGMTDAVTIVRTVIREVVDQLGGTDLRVVDFSGEQFAPVADRVDGFDVDGIQTMSLDEARLAGMSGLVQQIESASAEPVRVVLVTGTDPTGSAPEFNLTTGDRSDPGDTWAAGSWVSGWAARTGRVEAQSPTIGVAGVLPVVAGETYLVWIRYGTIVKRAGTLEVL